MTTTSKLATKFSRVLRDWLTEAEMDSVISQNQQESDKLVCHSHDYCDANEAMLESFLSVMGREIWMPSDAEAGRCTEKQHINDFDMWSIAWGMASDNKFNPTL